MVGFKDLLNVKGSKLRLQEKCKKIINPTGFINDKLKENDEHDEKYVELEKQVHEYYRVERSNIEDDILEAIQASISGPYKNNNLFRVTGHRFSQDPLCTLGSVKRPPGGRFNFGLPDSSFKNFHALYLADTAQTALFEKYPPLNSNDEVETQEGVKIDNCFFSLCINESYSNFKVSCKINKIIDLRNDDPLENFLEVIKQIPSPDHLTNFKKLYGHDRPYSVTTTTGLRQAILNPEYTYQYTWFQAPSNSQWFGYYCWLSGVQAIIYPSVKYGKGFNLCILVDNLENDPDSYIHLVDDIKYISESRKRIHHRNVHNFKCEEQF